MPNFKPVITQAYREILRREPDEPGLEAWNLAMNGGTSEAQVREAFLRSPEYAVNNPDGPPPPTPGEMSPLRVAGNQFRTEAGAPIKLLGMVICCDDPDSPVDEALEMGWPLVNPDVLDRMATYQQNYTIFRLGPSIGRGVFPDLPADAGEDPRLVGYVLRDGKYDLEQWNEDYWSRIRSLLSHARLRGIYVNCSIIDSWLLDHQLTPWEANRNHQGYSGGSLAVVRNAPEAVHEKWIRKVAATIGQFVNVIVTDGNESFKGRPTTAWVHGIRDIFRDEIARNGWTPRLFGTNSGITDEVDYIVLHDQGLPEPGELPIIVDEYPTRPVDAILIDAKRGWDLGSITYAYWRGEHSLTETTECLAGLETIVEGGDPAPFPDECPTLTKMGIITHQWLDRHFNQVSGPVEGGRHNIDLTPKFGNPPKPCNEEHPERCGGRPCEDPRGGVWELLEAPPGTQSRVDNNGFMFKVGPMAPGFYRVRCSPHPDSHDALGRPHRVAPDAARELTWTV